MSREVWVRRRDDGMADLTARLSSAEAALVSAQIDAVLAAQSPGPFPESEFTTSVGERKADALLELIHGHPEQGTIRPEVTVFAPADGEVEPRVEFTKGGASAFAALVDLLSHSTGATLRPLDPAIGAGAGATPAAALRYAPSAALRIQIRMRDGTCRHPGCSEPARSCDLDHVRPFNHLHPELGGLTIETNLMCLCRRHHLFKTFHGWNYHLSPDGTLTVLTPHGGRLTTHRTGPLAYWRTREKAAPFPHVADVARGPEVARVADRRTA